MICLGGLLYCYIENFACSEDLGWMSAVTSLPDFLKERSKLRTLLCCRSHLPRGCQSYLRGL